MPFCILSTMQRIMALLFLFCLDSSAYSSHHECSSLIQDSAAALAGRDWARLASLASNLAVAATELERHALRESSSIGTHRVASTIELSLRNGSVSTTKTPQISEVAFVVVRRH